MWSQRLRHTRVGRGVEMPPPDLFETRVRLLEAALTGPLDRIVGWAVAPSTTSEALADAVAEIAWRVADQLMVELDALP